MHTDKQGGESGSLIFHEVLVDGCVPDEATQGAVVDGFGLGIEERYGSFGVGSG